MPSKASVHWSIKELIEELKTRQANKFDCNIAVSGRRGDGKSSLIFKIFIRLKGFKPWKHLVYQRKNVIDLLKNQKFSFCFDDEAIMSSYKREFASKGQQELIKTVTMYRDNFNIYASAIPFFYGLDKDLRELIFMHIHIIERGLGVIFIPLEDNLHQIDPWDTRNNAKLEEKWQKKKQENPDFRFPYHRLSTFAGYITFGDLTSKQRKLYENIKKTKRSQANLTEEEKAKLQEVSFMDNVYNKMKEGKLTKDGLLQICLINGKKLSSVMSSLSKKLMNEGDVKRAGYYLNPTHKEMKIDKAKEIIQEMVPEV